MHGLSSFLLKCQVLLTPWGSPTCRHRETNVFSGVSFPAAGKSPPRSHSFSGPCVAPLGPARAPPPVPGARAPKPPKPSFRPSRRPAPSPWGLGAPTSPSERPSEAREPPISPGGPPAAPPAGPFNGHIKRAVGVGRSDRVPLHPRRLGWGGGGRGRARGCLI